MLEVNTWPGRISNSVPFRLPPGAMLVQDNLTCIVPGELRGRRGLRPGTFANTAAAASSYDGIAAAAGLKNGTAVMVYMLSDGSIKLGRAPS